MSAALTRTAAHGLAFELIDALGASGAARFHAEHYSNVDAIMGLMDAMGDHGMDTAPLVKPWRILRLTYAKIAGYPFSIEGINLYTGDRFSWSVPNLDDDRYDLAAVEDPPL